MKRSVCTEGKVRQWQRVTRPSNFEAKAPGMDGLWFVMEKSPSAHGSIGSMTARGGRLISRSCMNDG